MIGANQLRWSSAQLGIVQSRCYCERMPRTRRTAFVTVAPTLITPAAHADIGVPMSERRSLWKATAIAKACSYVLLALLIWPAWKLANHMPGFFGPVGEWIVEATFKVAGALTGRR